MALSSDFQTTYNLGDEELTYANATVMPTGTTTYSISAGHSVIVARIIGETVLIKGAYSAGNIETISVRPKDLVWDINDADKYFLKISTGGNSFVNLVTSIDELTPDEQDSYSTFVWNGLLRIK